MARTQRPRRLDDRKGTLIYCHKHNSWESDAAINRCEWALSQPFMPNEPCEWMKDPSIASIKSEDE